MHNSLTGSGADISDQEGGGGPRQCTVSAETAGPMLRSGTHYLCNNRLTPISTIRILLKLHTMQRAVQVVLGFLRWFLYMFPMVQLFYAVCSPQEKK